MIAVLNEAMGTCCWLNGKHVVSAEVKYSFHAPLALESDAVVEVWIDEEKSTERKLVTAGVLRLLDGTKIASSSGLFIWPRQAT